MNPSSFEFNLSLPRDSRLAAVVGELAQQAVTYADLDTELGEGFVDRVNTLAARHLAAGGNAACTVVYGCKDGVLFVTLDGETVKSN
jgi:hypothetical protein